MLILNRYLPEFDTCQEGKRLILLATRCCTGVFVANIFFVVCNTLPLRGGWASARYAPTALSLPADAGPLF